MEGDRRESCSPTCRAPSNYAHKYAGDHGANVSTRSKRSALNPQALSRFVKILQFLDHINAVVKERVCGAQRGQFDSQVLETDHPFPEHRDILFALGDSLFALCYLAIKIVDLCAQRVDALDRAVSGLLHAARIILRAFQSLLGFLLELLLVLDISIDLLDVRVASDGPLAVLFS